MLRTISAMLAAAAVSAAPLEPNSNSDDGHRFLSDTVDVVDSPASQAYNIIEDAINELIGKFDALELQQIALETSVSSAESRLTVVEGDMAAVKTDVEVAQAAVPKGIYYYTNSDPITLTSNQSHNIFQEGGV